MKILDLFCGAGGASMGLHFSFPNAHITGVDINPQPRYPFEFVQADALKFPLGSYDFYWASPPCQQFSSMRKGRWKDRKHPDLIDKTRELLKTTNKPYVIENVLGSPLIDPIMLCGTMFNLQTTYKNQLRRHRIFETSFSIKVSMVCNHNEFSAIGVYGGGQHPLRKNRLRKRDTQNHHAAYFCIKARKKIMEINWMIGKELNQAVPPAYAEYIGNQYQRMKT